MWLTSLRCRLCIGLLVGLFLPGCRLADETWRSSISEPLHYSNYWHDKWSRKRYRSIANDALAQEKALARAERDDYCNDPFTPAHELGFVDGFADYLYAGGTGQPPTIPPRQFWNAEYQGPDGYQAVLDWFEGYKHGAISARASGIRHYVTVPVSDAVASTTTPYPYGTTSAAQTMDNNSDDFNPVAVQTRNGNLVGLPPAMTRLPPLINQRQQ